MAEEGQAGAQAALNLLSNPGRLLSVTQVGVTLASLGLGWAGEDTLYRILLTSVPSAALRHWRRTCCTALVSCVVVSGDQLFPRGDGRGGSQESGDRQGRPPGGAGGAGAAGVLPAVGTFRGDHRTVGGRHHARAASSSAATRRPFRRGTEADRQFQPRPRLLAGSPGGHDPPRARPGQHLGARNHGAAQRHRVHRRGRHAGRGAAHHDREQHSRLPVYEGDPREDHRDSALQGPAAGLGGARQRHSHRTSQPRFPH